MVVVAAVEILRYPMELVVTEDRVVVVVLLVVSHCPGVPDFSLGVPVEGMVTVVEALAMGNLLIQAEEEVVPVQLVVLLRRP